MTDALLAPNDQKEELSRAYLHAIAAAAGYATAIYSLDRDGIDLRVQSGGRFRPALEFQLKATEQLGEATDGTYRFALPRRNYDLLRETCQTPRLLVVLGLPHDEDWVTITDRELILRGRALWLSLHGAEPTENVASVTVAIPQQNVLDMASLGALMDQSREGTLQ